MEIKVRYFTVFVFLLVLAIQGCSQQLKKKPSQDSLTATEALRVIEEVRYGYEKKDESILKKHLGTTLLSHVLHELDFDKASLTYSVQLVTLKSGKVYVKCNWESDIRVGNNNYSDEGSTTFVLRGSPLKIIDIEGSNPLQIPRT
jgi:hypothetical protein